MTSIATRLRTSLGDDPAEFSIILGGPLFQLLRRAHMSGDALELARRRMVFIALLAWLPLLLLAAIEGNALHGPAAIPFMYDLQAHARFLVALPLLIVAERVVHMRMRPIAREFLVRELVPEAALARFQHALHAAMSLRRSIAAELVMLVVVYAAGVPLVWREMALLDVTTWYSTAGDTGSRLTGAGIWYAYVSVPLFQFLLLRWYFRMFVWMRFLWSVSRIPLDLHVAHADRMAGLSFLSSTVFAFVPLALAHGAILSGTIANRIFYAGANLMDARFEVAVVVVFFGLLVFAPLTVFAGQVATAKRAAMRAYGRLAQRYVRDFDAAWLPGGMPAAASPLGAADIQSLADLGNSMDAMKSTRFVPITRDAILGVVIATLLPVAPLALTIVPAEEMAKRLLQLLL
jgi:hypothetical protein